MTLMMQAPQTNRRLEQLLTLYVAHPRMTNEDAARLTGLSAGWISRVVRSDLFQARLRDELEKHRSATLESVRKRVVVVADKALESIEDRLDSKVYSEKFLTDATKLALDSLGFGQKEAPSGPDKHLHVHLTADDIREARQLVGSARTPAKLGSSNSPDEDRAKFGNSAEALAFALTENVGD